MSNIIEDFYYGNIEPQEVNSELTPKLKKKLSNLAEKEEQIKHGSVLRAVPGITVEHEMVGAVEDVGADVTNVKLYQMLRFKRRLVKRSRRPD